MLQFSSVAQSCLTLCDPMNCSTPGLPVRHQLREFTQIHVHRVGDAIQPSHPLSPPSPPAPVPPSIRVFSNESTLRMRQPKYWSCLYPQVLLNFFCGNIVCLKKLFSFSIQQFYKKLRSWHPVPLLHGKQIGKLMESVTDFIFGSSKITTDGDCSHEIKRHLLLGRKAMTNLNRTLKSRDITLLTKLCLVKVMVFFFSSHVWM